MKEKKTKKVDPLLGNDESQNQDDGQTVEIEATPTPAIPAEKPVEAVKPAKVSTGVDTVAQTKDILAKSPHVNFIVPLGEGENAGSSETVQINGYRLTIQKGVMVNIPVQVANLLAEKYRIAMTAGQEKRIDRASDVSEALG
jgi:hypothetical protein